MTQIVEGIVEATSEKGKYYGLRLNQKWFNGFGSSPVEKDDLVRIEYTVNEKGGTVFSNIKTVTLLDENQEQQPVAEHVVSTNSDEFVPPENAKPANKKAGSTFEEIADEQIKRMEYIATRLERVNLSKESFPDKARMVNNVLIIANRELELVNKVRK